MNLDLLFKKDESRISFVRCYGTGYGISEQDIKHIEYSLEEKYSVVRKCEITGVSCKQFFNDFWHRISFR